MTHQPSESVADFAHRFLETQHSLEKLIPGIHREDNDVELINAFMLKLHPKIGKELVSRDSTFPTLTAVIEAAKRVEAVELVSPPPPVHEDWKPNALVAHQPSRLSEKPFAGHPRQNSRSNPSQHRNQNTPGISTCRVFNKFEVASCELPNNQCSRGYAHKCSKCFKANCKAYLHVKETQPNVLPPSGFNKARGNFSRNSPQALNSRNRPQANLVTPLPEDNHALIVNSVKDVVNQSLSSLKNDLTTSIKNEVKRQLPQPSQVAPNVATSQDSLFGMPAINTRALRT